jgi:hypothetical protein
VPNLWYERQPTKDSSLTAVTEVRCHERLYRAIPRPALTQSNAGITRMRRDAEPEAAANSQQSLLLRPHSGSAKPRVS